MLNFHPIKVNTINNRYTLLLIALISFILFSPLTTESNIGRASFLVLFIFTILGVSKSAVESKMDHWYLTAIGCSALLFHLLGVHDGVMHLASKLIAIIFFILAIWQFSVDVFLRSKANMDTLFGSICIYLLIGTVFASIYIILQEVFAGSFVFSANNAVIYNVFDFYYFSFITLTTTGYGDIVPNNQWARAFVTVESVTGLFYLATLVAHLATMMNSAKE